MSVAICNNYHGKHFMVGEENSPVEILCNLTEVSIPVDNDIVFGVDSERDTIIVDNPGSHQYLHSGDM